MADKAHDWDRDEAWRRIRINLLRPEYIAVVLLIFSICMVVSIPGSWKRVESVGLGPVAVAWMGSVVATVVGGLVALIAMIIAIAHQRYGESFSFSGYLSLGLSIIVFLIDLLVLMYGSGADPYRGNF